MLLTPTSTTRVFRHGHLACGIGAGAKGFNMANPRVGNIQARFECAGGIDVDPGAIANFERMTGVKGTVMDLFSRDQYRAFHGREPGPAFREAVPDDLREIFGRLDCLFASFPCKGFSSLLSQTASLTDKYQALNALTLRGIWLALEAYRDDPIACIILENVPCIATRGRWLLDQICALLRSFGYSVNEDTHDCGVLGNLAQSRKRFLLIARYPEKLPNFIYQPRHHRLRGVGEVIGKLPLPGDPRGGPMHRVPALQWKTWVRLAFVEAGKDWRSLNRLAVENGVLRDYGIVLEADLRDNAYGVCRWDERGPLVTSARAPGQGRFSIADPRAISTREGSGFLGVNGWSGTVGVISSRGLPTNGGYSVADPRPGYPASAHTSLLAVSNFSNAARCVSGARHVAGGALSVADPRPSYGIATHRYVLGVLGWTTAKGVVTGSSKPTSGAHSVADPRIFGHPASVQCGVKAWGQSSGVVTANMWVGSGPNSVADPRIAGKPRFNNTFRIVGLADASPAIAGPGGPAGGLAVADPRAPEGRHVNGKYRVTGYAMVSNAVIGASTTGMGAFVVADPKYAGAGLGDHHNKMRVVSDRAPAPVVTASDRVGSGALSVADPRPRCLSRADRTAYLTQGHYGVARWRDHSGAVPAFAKNNNGHDQRQNDRRPSHHLLFRRVPARRAAQLRRHPISRSGRDYPERKWRPVADLRHADHRARRPPGLRQPKAGRRRQAVDRRHPPGRAAGHPSCRSGGLTMSRYVARYTRLHPRLWAPYSITAYPNGFHGWPEGLAAPVWTPNARVITTAGAASRPLGDCATLDAAIEACWAHLATLDEQDPPC